MKLKANGEAKVVYGPLYHMDDAWIEAHAERLGFKVKELKKYITDARWGQAREWFKGAMEWFKKIHNSITALNAINNMPCEYHTGDDHIDEVAGELVTYIVAKRTAEHRKNRPTKDQLYAEGKARRGSKRAAYRMAEKAAAKNRV